MSTGVEGSYLEQDSVGSLEGNSAHMVASLDSVGLLKK